MIYIREARRMVSDYVMTQHDCIGKRAMPDPVGLGSFGMDSHVLQYIVNEKGHVRRDGMILRTPPKPYSISYRSIVPRKGECKNLFPPIALSASHVAHGSIRMEPVFMVLSQSAATAASIAIHDGISVQEVSYKNLRHQLDIDNQICNGLCLRISERTGDEQVRSSRTLLDSRAICDRIACVIEY